MRIMILPSWYPSKYYPVAGSFIRNQAEMLAEAGVEVVVLGAISTSLKKIIKYYFSKTEDNFSSSKLVQEHVFYPVHIPYFDSLNRLIRLTWGRILVRKYLKKSPLPGLVHVHTYLQGDLAMDMQRRYNVNFILTEHFSKLIRKNSLGVHELSVFRRISSRAVKKMAVSKYYAQELFRHHSVQFDHLPNFIDTSDFTPSEKSQGSQLRILSVGTLNRNKGMHLILKAFHIILQSQIEANLTIVGRGPERFALKELALDLQVNEKVEFIDFLQKVELIDKYRESDVVVSASETETFGLTLLESISTGTPVVSTAEGPREFVRNGVTGFTVERTPEQIADGIKKIIQTTFDIDRMWNYVHLNYGKNVVVEKLFETYSEHYPHVIGDIP